MDDCCEVHEVPRAQRRVLQVVLWINAAMFVAESVAGLLAHSTALFADSMDMLGDAIVYGFSLYVVGRGLAWQARAALLKGVVMAAFSLGVLAQAAVKIAQGLAPAVVKRFREAVMAIKALGISLLIAESNLVSAATMADRLYVVDRGEIVFHGTPKDALANEEVMRALRG